MLESQFSHDIDKLLVVFVGLVTPPMMEISSVYVSTTTLLYCKSFIMIILIFIQCYIHDLCLCLLCSLLLVKLHCSRDSKCLTRRDWHCVQFLSCSWRSTEEVWGTSYYMCGPSTMVYWPLMLARMWTWHTWPDNGFSGKLWLTFGYYCSLNTSSCLWEDSKNKNPALNLCQGMYGEQQPTTTHLRLCWFSYFAWKFHRRIVTWCITKLGYWLNHWHPMQSFQWKINRNPTTKSTSQVTRNNSIPKSPPPPRSRSLKGSLILPVFARQSWVYSALTFCNSASTAAVLAARDTKMACWVCKVEDITKKCRRETGRGSFKFSEDGQDSWGYLVV